MISIGLRVSGAYWGSQYRKILRLWPGVNFAVSELRVILEFAGFASIFVAWILESSLREEHGRQAHHDDARLMNAAA